MATRLYFSRDVAAGVTPSSWSAGWNKTTGVGSTLELSTKKKTDTTGGQQSITNAGVGVSGQFTALFRNVSPPLQAQTISGSLKGQFIASQASAAENYTLAIAVKVIQSDGTDRGVLIAVSASDDTSTTPPELATTNTNRRVLNSSESASLSFSDLAVSAGDRIVVEVGFRQASASTSLGGAFRGCDIDGGTVADLGENDTDTTGLPWVEFTDTISFDPLYFGSASTPADNGTGTADPTAVTPPSGMLAGDLVCMIGQERSLGTTLQVSQAGGQTWTSENPLSISNQTVRLFWCTFNGTWSANPSVDFLGTTCNSVQMHVFRAPTADHTWSVNQALVELDDSTDPFTITGQTTTGSDPTVTLGGWFSADDNTWGSISGTGWVVTGLAQYRNTSGQDQSASYAHKIQTSAGATGNVSKSQLTLGADASTTFIISFAAVAPAAAVEETNVFSITRFRPWLPTLNIALRQNIAADFTTAATQPETNIHFIGKFKPQTLLQQRGLWLSSAADEPPFVVPSTPINFLGKFRPTEFWPLRDLRYHEAQDDSAPQTQPETNTHFIGKFKPDRLNLLHLLRHNIAADFTSTVAFATNIHFIGKFSPYRYSLNQQLRQNIAADFTAAQTQAETNTHFRARFQPYRFTLTSGLRHAVPLEAQAVEAETNVHFVGKFVPYRLVLQSSLRHNIAADDSAPQTQAETNTYFIAKFQPIKLQLLRDLWLHEAQDTSFRERDTEPHFIGKFQPYRLTLQSALRHNIAADDSFAQTQAETNTHFLGKFQPLKIALLRSLWLHEAQDTSFAQPSTPPHFVVKFQPYRMALQIALRQNIAADDSTAQTQPETNTHFIAKFAPTKYTLLALLRYNIAADFSSVVVPSTPIFNIARFQPTTIRLQQALRQNTANDTSAPQTQAETNTHFVGRFRQPQIAKLASLWQTGADSPAPIVVENVQSFIGRFRPTMLRTSRALYQTSAYDTSFTPPVVTFRDNNPMIAYVGRMMVR